MRICVGVIDPKALKQKPDSTVRFQARFLRSKRMNLDGQGLHLHLFSQGLACHNLINEARKREVSFQMF